VRFLKPVGFIVFSLPLIGVIYTIASNSLGPDPAEALAHVTGEWAIRMLLATLLISTIARRFPAYKRILVLRRMSGLFTFFYSLLHLIVFALLYVGFDLALLLHELGERPYISVGFLAWLIMVPLAITSNNRMISKLGGRRWKSLHRLVYLALLLVLLHVIWQVRSSWGEALFYTFCGALLMLERLAAKLAAR